MISPALQFLKRIGSGGPAAIPVILYDMSLLAAVLHGQHLLKLARERFAAVVDFPRLVSVFLRNSQRPTS